MGNIGPKIRLGAYIDIVGSAHIEKPYSEVWQHHPNVEFCDQPVAIHMNASTSGSSIDDKSGKSYATAWQIPWQSCMLWSQSMLVADNEWMITKQET